MNPQFLLVSKLLLDRDLIETKEELSKYKNKYDIPIKIYTNLDEFFQKSDQFILKIGSTLKTILLGDEYEDMIFNLYFDTLLR